MTHVEDDDLVGGRHHGCVRVGGDRRGGHVPLQPRQQVQDFGGGAGPGQGEDSVVRPSGRELRRGEGVGLALARALAQGRERLRHEVRRSAADDRDPLPRHRQRPAEAGRLGRGACPALAADLPEGLVECGQFTFLGRGWTVGLANEAGLKMREASLSWTEAYPAMEYRHGPISITTAGTATWMFGEAPEGLAEQVCATGGLWIEGRLDPLAELVRAQRLAVAVAAARGLDPDRPRHLTRSVILAP